METEHKPHFELHQRVQGELARRVKAQLWMDMGSSGSSVDKRIRLQCRRSQFDPWVGEIPWKRDRLPTLVFMGFPRGSNGKESACNAGYLGLIPGLGRSPGKEKGYPLQYSGMENSMDYIVHGIAKSRTQRSDFHFYFSGVPNF